ncbi:ParB N-terminal domain-containing protein [Paenibacillus sabinae]|uniref:ParB-like nuclease n=1 Tax=Paenibacillus sabinae T27 TaxID=1268072 RepID=X5A3W0_9BACL|nr:ParB N-terminal domain-containing protein [Paenibacillus sabinae]AHV99003.1 ParB-like nuclease [Paenibacillus sabinae T27]
MLDVLERPTEIHYVPPSSLVEHPEAWRIPEMSPEEWADFNESVRSRGAVTDPVFALPDGRVFDGRHRLRAAKENELPTLPVITWDITEDNALDRMRQSATERRSLLTGQKVMINLEFGELLQRLREEARNRQGERTDLSAVLRGSSGDSDERTSEVAEHIAQLSGTSARNVYKAQAVLREAPDLAERIKSGEITINRAETELRKRKQSEQPADEPKPPPKAPRSPEHEKLGKIGREIEALGTLQPIPGESPLSPSNLVRYHLDNDVLAFARGMCVSFEAFYDGVDDETTEQYVTRIKRIMLGCSLIVSKFDNDETVRALYEQLAYLVEGTCSDEGTAAITKTITEGRKQNEERENG